MNKSTMNRLLAPIRVERRDDTALTVSAWTIKKRIRQMSATFDCRHDQVFRREVVSDHAGERQR